MKKLYYVPILLSLSAAGLAQDEELEFNETFEWTGDYGETEAEVCKVPGGYAYDWIQDWREQAANGASDQELDSYSMGDCSCAENDISDGEVQYTCSVEATASFHYNIPEDEE